MIHNSIAVELAIGTARSRDARPTQKSEFIIACRFQLRLPFLQNSLDVADREQSTKSILRVDHQELVDADMFSEETVSPRNRIIRDLLLGNRMNLCPWQHRIDHLDVGIPRANDVPRK